MSAPHEQRQSGRRPSWPAPGYWTRSIAVMMSAACALAASGCATGDDDASMG